MENTSVAKTEVKQPTASNSERFTQMVVKEFASMNMGTLSDGERALISGYFVGIDTALRNMEAERLRKNERNTDHSYDNKLPATWANVDLSSLAIDLAHYAKVGLDMSEDNTLFPIPFKDNKSGKYTITLMEGYNGIAYQAHKYALVPFKDVVVEVVYSTDKFRPIKKDHAHPIESYEFEITNAFERGTPVGVFGYIVYDDPTKNKLVVFSKSDVEKRKPKYASAEFWGGTSTVYKDGKRVTAETDGWMVEMWEKTMKREIYSAKHIPRDPHKGSEVAYIENREKEYREMVVESQIDEVANSGPALCIPPAPEPVRNVEVTKSTILDEPGF